MPPTADMKTRKKEKIQTQQTGANAQPREPAKKYRGEPQPNAGQHENHGNEAEAEAADYLFSPSVAEELGRALHGINGSKVFKGQHRDHEVAGQRPDDADDLHDDAAGQAHAL